MQNMISYLIYNKYYNNSKSKLLYDRIFDVGKDMGISFIMLDNSEANIKLSNNKLQEVDFVLFWDKDVKLARELEKLHYKVFNNSAAIEICDDKSKTFLFLKNTNIKIPKTIVSPLIYYGSIEEDDEFINNAISIIKFPMIVKECYGSYGMQVYKVDNIDDLKKLIKVLGTKPFIIQEFIKTSYGRDIRVEVVGGNVVASVLRENKNNDFRANITNGAIAEKVIINKDQEKMALDACKYLGLDFGGIDILFGENDEPIFCEANSNAYPLNVSNVTGIDIIKEILIYIKNKCK